MMSSNSWRLMAAVLVASVTFGSSDGLVCPGPVEEGSSVSLTCDFDTPTTVLVWQLEVSGKFKDVSSCQVAQTCNNLMSPDFNAVVDTSSSDRTKYDSTLTISRINRNQTKIRCLNQICQLEVYVKPTKIQCDGEGAVLGHRGLPYRSYLDIACTTASTFPKATCNFSSTLSQDRVSSSSAVYTYTLLADGNYMTRCSYTISLAGFQTGLHTFTMTMAPGLSTPVPSATVVHQSQQTLVAPFLSLETDCPEGVIKAGMTASCTCKMTHPGYPQGWAKWYTSANRTTGSIFAYDATTITLTYNPQNPCPIYECSPESALGRLIPGLTFVPNFEENEDGCKKSKDVPISQENSSNVIIGISVAFGCVVIALILGAVVLYLKLKEKQKRLSKNTEYGSPSSRVSMSPEPPQYTPTWGSHTSMEHGVSNPYTILGSSSSNVDTYLTPISIVSSSSESTYSDDVDQGSVAGST